MSGNALLTYTFDRFPPNQENWPYSENRTRYTKYNCKHCIYAWSPLRRSGRFMGECIIWENIEVGHSCGIGNGHCAQYEHGNEAEYELDKRSVDKRRPDEVPTMPLHETSSINSQQHSHKHQSGHHKIRSTWVHIRANKLQMVLSRFQPTGWSLLGRSKLLLQTYVAFLPNI